MIHPLTSLSTPEKVCYTEVMNRFPQSGSKDTPCRSLSLGDLRPWGILFLWFGIFGALGWFNNLLIPDPEEIEIRAMHRETPSLVVIKLRRCDRLEQNTYEHNLCVNRALNIR